MKTTLRDYQQDGIKLIKAALSGHQHPDIEYRRGHSGKARSVLFALATGAGKTVTYSVIAEGASSKGKRVLILEHRKELIKQASVALARLGVYHQIVAPPAKINWIRSEHIKEVGRPYIRQDAHVAVASVQTLGRRMAWLAEWVADILVIDECHHSVAGTWARILSACPTAAVIGVTATPCRTNGEGLGKVFQALVSGVSMGWLIDNAYLVPPRIFAPPLGEDTRDELDHLRTVGGDVDLEAMAKVLDKPSITGRAVEEYGNHCPGVPAIVFCVNRNHARHVAEQFQAAGWRFYVIDGTMADVERDRLLAGLLDGSVQGLVSVDLISEGTDLPCATAAFMLRRTKSLSLFLQMAGRVLRPVYAPGYDLTTLDGRLSAIDASGKTHGLLFDHVGNVGAMINGRWVDNHGKPQTDHQWTLEGKPQRKRGPRDDDEPSLTQCPACYHVHEPAPACPECGHVYGPTVRKFTESDQSLIEVPDEGEAARKERIQIGLLRTREAMIEAGVGAKRAAIIDAARREKDALRDELRRLLAETGETMRERELMDLKPKALKAEIARLGESLFMGVVDA